MDLSSQQEPLSTQDIIALWSLLGRLGPLGGHQLEASSGNQIPSQTPSSTAPALSTQALSMPLLSSQPVMSTQQAPLTVTPLPRNITLLATFPPHSSHPSLPWIMPYHSALPGAHGHPPRSSPLPMGLQSLGGGTTQANQWRLAAAAAANLPPHSSLPACTTRAQNTCRAVVAPPSLMPAFSIVHVLTNDGNSTSQVMKIRVKVYPPYYSSNLFFFTLIIL